MNVLAITVCTVFMIVSIGADTPANCTYEDIVGTWKFKIGDGDNTRDLDCSNFSSTGYAKYQVRVQLKYPDVAVDEFNNEGFWTLVYNQGFEVVIAGRKYFTFSKFEDNTSYCDLGTPGWSHDVLGNDWACFIAKKDEEVRKVLNTEDVEPDTTLRFGQGINTLEMVGHINRAQKSWKATRYDQFAGYSHEQFINMAGGKASRIHSRPGPAPVTAEQVKMVSKLPKNFDWRDINGASFVSPVRNQDSCGSCYAFSSNGMAEARVRILTNNTQTPVFSPQDIVECSEYSQGCLGGFPYLVGGKYAEDFGLVLEKCHPYTGQDGFCTTDSSCSRHYMTNYRYIGGYYGGCNEPAMMEAIFSRGPIAVNFEVYDDFRSYQSGIYYHIEDVGRSFQPFEIVNHAVVIVGWGEDSASEKYWIVKNSWGKSWGLNGYFWIRRGTDECNIESIAMEADPILTFYK